MEINLASMFTDATSLTIVPILTLALFSRRCLRVVVLPEPRKPARRMVGMGLMGDDGSVGLAPSTGDDAFRYADEERVRGEEEQEED